MMDIFKNFFMILKRINIRVILSKHFFWNISEVNTVQDNSGWANMSFLLSLSMQFCKKNRI